MRTQQAFPQFFHRLLMVVLFGAVPAEASAQFYSIPLGNGYNLYWGRARSFSVPIMGPYGPTTVGFVDAGFRPRNQSIITPYYRGSYLGAGFSAGGYNPLAKQQQNDLARAQRQATARANEDARREIADQWAYERGARPVAVASSGPAVKLGQVDRALLHAHPDDITSGKALNNLLQALKPLIDQPGKPVDSSLLGPELVASLNFSGNAKADALNLLRAGRLPWPTPLRAREFADWRNDLESAFDAVLLAANDGRPLPAPLAERVLDTVNRGRTLANPLLRTLPFSQAAEVARFFNRLTTTITVLQQPEAAGLYVGNWAILGIRVGDLTRHMAKHGLQFAPGDELAYSTLHRELVSYYLALAQQRASAQ